MEVDFRFQFLTYDVALAIFTPDKIKSQKEENGICFQYTQVSDERRGDDFTERERKSFTIYSIFLKRNRRAVKTLSMKRQTLLKARQENQKS